MRIHLFLILLLAVALGAGCGRVHHLYYLQGEFAEDNTRDWPLDLVNAVDDLAQIKGKTLTVQVADPNKTIERKVSRINRKLKAEYFTNDFRPKFETRVANTMWQSRVFSDVCAAGDPTPIAQPDLILKVALTQWYEGYGILRSYFGFGLGAARVQWEGTLLDARTNRPLFSFADARLHPGGPAPLGLSFKIWRGGQLLTEVLIESVHDLGEALRMGTDDTEPWLAENISHPMTRPVAPRPAAVKPAAPKPLTPKPAAPKPTAKQPAPAAPAVPAMSGPDQ